MFRGCIFPHGQALCVSGDGEGCPTGSPVDLKSCHPVLYEQGAEEPGAADSAVQGRDV